MKRTKDNIKKIKEPIILKNRLFNIKDIIKEEGAFNIILVVLSILLFLFFALSHLGSQIYTDEPVLWYPWIEQFGHALKTFDFRGIDKPYNYPGLPVIILGSILTAGNNIAEIPPGEFQNYLFLMKSPIIIFNAISLILIYIYSSKLWNKEVALLMVVLLSLHPLIIAFSQHTQGDTTLWNSFFLSILSFFLYIKNGKSKFIFFTAIFFSVAVLSKFVGMLLYPLLFIFLYGEYFFRKISRSEFIIKLKGLFAIYGLFLLFLFLLYPFLWYNPSLILENSFLHYSINKINPLFPILALILIIEVVWLKGKISDYFRRENNINIVFILFIVLFFISVIFGILLRFKILSLGGGQVFFGGVHVKDQITTLSQYSSSLNAIIPWYVFAGLIAVLIKQLFFKSEITNKQYIIYSLFIAFVFAIAAILGSYQIWVKYLLFLIPLLYLAFSLLFVNSFTNTKILTPLILIIAVSELITVYPTYFSYRNTFIPYNNKNIYDGNYGGYELAQKANKLENVDQIKVLSDTYGFMFYFKGVNSVVQHNITEKELKTYDYVFLSSFGKREKSAWGMLPYSLRLLYDLPRDSSLFMLGDSLSFVKFIKVPKYNYKYVPNNSFDTDFYIDMSKDISISFWVNVKTDSTTQVMSLTRTVEDFINFKVNKEKVLIQYADSTTLIANIQQDKWQNIVWVNKANKDKTNTQTLYINAEKSHFINVRLKGEEIKGFFLNNDFIGEVNDVRIYNQTINKPQINIIYNNGKIITKSSLNVGDKTFTPIRHFTQNK